MLEPHEHLAMCGNNRTDRGTAQNDQHAGHRSDQRLRQRIAALLAIQLKAVPITHQRVRNDPAEINRT